jgi:deoxyribodipyrimidine photo-lyase
MNIFWFRRDLRLTDNAGLYNALRAGEKVQCIFIFDKNILEKLEDKEDSRVTFIFDQVNKLKRELKELGSDLDIYYSTPSEVFKSISENKQVKCVFTNRDYEPYALQRDEEIKDILSRKNIDFKTFKDHVIFEKDEVLKDDGKPYTIFTPYKNKWYKKLNTYYLSSYPTEKYFYNLNSNSYETIKPITLESMGFSRSNLEIPIIEYQSILKDYHTKRDFPAVKGTSKISIHLRFGTVSIRELARNAQGKSEVWLNELIWRDFYSMILFHFPHAAKNSFKPAYDKIIWRNNEDEFQKWCDGKTGYPIVDAGMRELNATGFMHNRVRMIVASFLIKHLLIDWRWGEAYFAQKLLDFDLASNNGGWQWASSSGCDAAPYFRIFNPYEQTKKFDPQFLYIRKWVPEFQELTYPSPIVDHKFARERCLATYKKALA